jgi:hypothetical protein
MGKWLSLHIKLKTADIEHNNASTPCIMAQSLTEKLKVPILKHKIQLPAQYVAPFHDSVRDIFSTAYEMQNFSAEEETPEQYVLLIVITFTLHNRGFSSINPCPGSRNSL